MVIGLTGGIGSGKTTVARMFSELGIPIYIADLEAQVLIKRSKVIRRKLLALFGDKAYINGELNKPYIASQIFGDPELLSQMNAIIHPKVRSHFKRWLKKQSAPYVIYEAAILFEHNGHEHCDYVITVTAPKNERIKRVIKRDNSRREQVEAIMDNQWTDEQKIKLSDFVIKNSTLRKTRELVKDIHLRILNLKQ